MKNDLISRSALLEALVKKKAGAANKRYTEGFNDALMRFRSMVHNAPAVDAVPVERLGKIGKLFIPYSGCPRGPVGRMGEPVTLAEEAMFWGVIVDEDGTRFVPVVEEVLHELIEKACAVDAVALPCKPGEYWFDQNGDRIQITAISFSQSIHRLANMTVVEYHREGDEDDYAVNWIYFRKHFTRDVSGERRVDDD